MELTSDNVDGLLPHIDALLASCDYFAVDLEFTGVNGDEPTVDTAADDVDEQIQTLFSKTPEQCYEEKKNLLRQYSVMQVGFSIFTEQRKHNVGADDTNKQEWTTWQTELARLEDDIRHDVEQLLLWDSSIDANLRNLPVALCDMLLRQPDEFFARQSAFVDEQRRLLQNLQQVLHAIEPAKLMEVTHTMEVRIRLVEMYERWTTAAREWCTFYERAVKEGHTLAPAPGRVAGAQRIKTANHHAQNYKVHTFYAHLFPASGTMFNTTSIDTHTVGSVLAEHAMDFNKWIRSGLRFGTLKEYNELRLSTWLDAHYEYHHPNISIPSKAALRSNFGNALDGLMPLTPSEWNYVAFVINAPQTEARRLISYTRKVIEFARSKEKTYANGITTYIENRVTLRDEANALRLLNIRKANGRMERLANSPKMNSNSGCSNAESRQVPCFIQAKPCFPGTRLLSTLLYAAQRRRKAMVLHSGYSDLFFLLNTLYGDLPPTFGEFKTLVHDSFPVLYDTRTLACLPGIQNIGRMRSSLENTFKELRDSAHFDKPNFAFDCSVAGGDDPRRCLTAHNAGFDAVLTGMVYAYLKEALITNGIEMSRYCNMLQLYCSIFAVDFSQASVDVLIAPAGTKFVFAYQPHTECCFTAYDIQQTCLKYGLTITATHSSSGFLVFIFPDLTRQSDSCNTLRKIFNEMYTTSTDNSWYVEEIDATALISSGKVHCIECECPR